MQLPNGKLKKFKEFFYANVNLGLEYIYVLEIYIPILLRYHSSDADSPKPI